MENMTKCNPDEMSAVPESTNPTEAGSSDEWEKLLKWLARNDVPYITLGNIGGEQDVKDLIDYYGVSHALVTSVKFVMPNHGGEDKKQKEHFDRRNMNLHDLSSVKTEDVCLVKKEAVFDENTERKLIQSLAHNILGVDVKMETENEALTGHSSIPVERMQVKMENESEALTGHLSVPAEMGQVKMENESEALTGHLSIPAEMVQVKMENESEALTGHSSIPVERMQVKMENESEALTGHLSVPAEMVQVKMENESEALTGHLSIPAEMVQVKMETENEALTGHSSVQAERMQAKMENENEASAGHSSIPRESMQLAEIPQPNLIDEDKRLENLSSSIVKSEIVSGNCLKTENDGPLCAEQANDLKRKWIQPLSNDIIGVHVKMKEETEAFREHKSIPTGEVQLTEITKENLVNGEDMSWEKLQLSCVKSENVSSNGLKMENDGFVNAKEVQNFVNVDQFPTKPCAQTSGIIVEDVQLGCSYESILVPEPAVEVVISQETSSNQNNHQCQFESDQHNNNPGDTVIPRDKNNIEKKRYKKSKRGKVRCKPASILLPKTNVTFVLSPDWLMQGQVADTSTPVLSSNTIGSVLSRNAPDSVLGRSAPRPMVGSSAPGHILGSRFPGPVLGSIAPGPMLCSSAPSPMLSRNNPGPSLDSNTSFSVLESEGQEILNKTVSRKGATLAGLSKDASVWQEIPITRRASSKKKVLHSGTVMPNPNMVFMPSKCSVTSPPQSVTINSNSSYPVITAPSISSSQTEVRLVPVELPSSVYLPCNEDTEQEHIPQIPSSITVKDLKMMLKEKLLRKMSNSDETRVETTCNILDVHQQKSEVTLQMHRNGLKKRHHSEFTSSLETDKNGQNISNPQTDLVHGDPKTVNSIPHYVQCDIPDVPTNYVPVHKGAMTLTNETSVHKECGYTIYEHAKSKESETAADENDLPNLCIYSSTKLLPGIPLLESTEVQPKEKVRTDAKEMCVQDVKEPETARSVGNCIDDHTAYMDMCGREKNISEDSKRDENVSSCIREKDSDGKFHVASITSFNNIYGKMDVYRVEKEGNSGMEKYCVLAINDGKRIIMSKTAHEEVPQNDMLRKYLFESR